MATALNQQSPDINAQCYHNSEIKNINITGKEFDDNYKLLFSILLFHLLLF